MPKLFLLRVLAVSRRWFDGQNSFNNLMHLTISVIQCFLFFKGEVQNIVLVPQCNWMCGICELSTHTFSAINIVKKWRIHFWLTSNVRYTSHHSASILILFWRQCPPWNLHFNLLLWNHWANWNHLSGASYLPANLFHWGST